MITSSTRAHASSGPSVETRSTSRAERGGDFREELTRTRELERADERSTDTDRASAEDARAPTDGERASDDTRSSADGARSKSDSEHSSAQARATRDDPSESESAHDDVTTDASTQDVANEGEPVDSEAKVALFAESATERPASTVTAARSAGDKDTSALEAAKPEAALVVPTITTPVALDVLDATPGLEARLHALFAAGDDAAPDPSAPKTSTTPVAPVGASATAPTADATAAVVDPTAHAAPELARSAASSQGSSETASSAIAALAGRNASTADVAAIPQAPVTRLSPADLPQFFETVQVRVDGALGNAFVELEPPELGRLTFELSLQPDGGVRADVRAENQDGFAALGARVTEMRTALIERGFTSADVQISLGLGERESHHGSDSKSPRGSRNQSTRELDAERVLALARSVAGSIDVWA